MVTIAGHAVDAFGASTSIAGLVASTFIIGTLLGRLIVSHRKQGCPILKQSCLFLLLTTIK
ncbi:hypothetical protein JMM81_07290 [Bacillus sp. V3B]|uniref:hypothetical protein n=1 Tax=Bacillus sp. V3B TaxID=2804915 RepID=UPI00210E5698|nr:hypothetical protein [Bacillus sp. V3B]MCQ6274773.1 hypothetical protein [Bacillus sp. V3B]